MTVNILTTVHHWTPVCRQTSPANAQDESRVDSDHSPSESGSVEALGTSAVQPEMDDELQLGEKR